MGATRTEIPRWAAALAVFAGGASYGAIAPFTKLVYGAGFSGQDAVAAQGSFGRLWFVAIFCLQRLAGRKAAPLSPRGVGMLLLTGCVTCGTCIFYDIALSRLPVAVAITMLFQFTWLGSVIQAVAMRKLPHPLQLAAAAIVVGGTLFASGLFSAQLASSFDLIGIACGLLAAVCCASFMFLSSKVEVDMPPIQRGVLICAGSALLGNLINPGFIAAGTVAAIAPLGLVLGFFAMLFPVVLFGLGTPKLPAGTSTVLASSELPCSILLTWIILGEGIDTMQFLGMLLILAGVAVSQLPALQGRQRSRSLHAHPTDKRSC